MGKTEEKQQRAQKNRRGRPATNGTSKRLTNTVRPYVQHILVCTDKKSKQCKKGGPKVLKAFQEGIKKRKLSWQVMVTEIGHVGGCNIGPNVLMYPEGIWYGRVGPNDVEEIINHCC